MTSTHWIPLSRRIAGLDPEPPAEGVPLYLEGELHRFLRRQFNAHHGLEGELRLRLRMPGLLVDRRGEDLLDVVDAFLYWHPDSVWEDDDDEEAATPEQEEEWQAELRLWRQTAGQVEQMLSAAGSAWRVNKQCIGLERRLDETVTAAVSLTRATAQDEAAGHLATAWQAAYGRQPDPDKAYTEAVKAVEAVACPMVCPNNTRRSLGTVIRDLQNQADRWELALGDASGAPSDTKRLVEMLALLWQGQSRHAGSPNSRRHTQIEGESTVHLAATLVQWLNSGVLRRKP